MRKIQLIIITSILFAFLSCKEDKNSVSIQEDKYFEDYEAPANKWGFIDTTGQWAIDPIYDKLRSFDNGVAIANYHGKWGFINQNGDIVVDHLYRAAYPFSDGLARIQNFEKQYGFINRQGEMIIPDTFDLVFDFSNHLARAKKGLLYGFIDQQGNWKIEPEI